MQNDLSAFYLNENHFIHKSLMESLWKLKERGFEELSQGFCRRLSFYFRDAVWHIVDEEEELKGGNLLLVSGLSLNGFGNFVKKNPWKF
jgi:hypothetical protein